MEGCVTFFFFFFKQSFSPFNFGFRLIRDFKFKIIYLENKLKLYKRKYQKIFLTQKYLNDKFYDQINIKIIFLKFVIKFSFDHEI